VSNADVIFKHFASILKANKKQGCTLNDNDIDTLCNGYARLCMLWDGAFVFASKVESTDADITMYKRFSKAAVYAHVAAGISVTHKVHLMWKHVALQMSRIPGGLGDKREDWLEQQHQTGDRLRTHYRRTANFEVRARAMAGAYHRDTNPLVMAQVDGVSVKYARGPRKDYTTKEELRKRERVHSRMMAIKEWEEAASLKEEKCIKCPCFKK